MVDKALWSQPETMAQKMKALQIKLDGFRPIEEAISCAGGVKQDALTERLELKQTSGVLLWRNAGLGCSYRRIFADSMLCYRTSSW